MKVAYIRTSTAEQNEARQVVMMQEQGVERIFMDKLSGKDTNRPQLQEMLSFLREGDILVVESFSRLARSTRDLLSIVDELNAKGVVFISLKESVDTATPTGKFMLTVFAGLAELERENILLRQKEGIAEAKKAGKYQGRPKAAYDEAAFLEAVRAWRNGEITARAAMDRCSMKPNTFYRRVKEQAL
jgi:DNA invertase Pin-like site-specific DNA recombinase